MAAFLNCFIFADGTPTAVAISVTCGPFLQLRLNNKLLIMDALHYFGIDFSWIRGPMYIFFDPNMDEEWRLLIQASALCVVLTLIYFLDQAGAFVHIKSRRAPVPALLVALCAPEDADELRELVERKGVEDDELTAEEEVNYVDLPRRAEHIDLVCGSRKMSGIVIEAGPPRAGERACKTWEGFLKNSGSTVLLLKPGDSVIATLLDHVKIDGWILQIRYPRFLRKAFKRRTCTSCPVTTYATFSSVGRKRVMGVIPVSPNFEKELLKGLPKEDQEAAKDK